MPEYEVFVQLKRTTAFGHVGSVRAASDELALHAAKEVYVRRDSPLGVWVIDRRHILSFDPRDHDLFEIAGSKEYRQPSFFTKRYGESPDAPPNALT